MAGNELNRIDDNNEQFETQTLVTTFLPDLCTPASVLALVLVGELLALALTIVSAGLAAFDWSKFGLVSFLIQWIMLVSAATLCPLASRLNVMPVSHAFALSYVVILVYTVIFSLLGKILLLGWMHVSVLDVAANTIIAAIFAGILLRYFYVQARLTQKEQSEADARLIALQSRIRPHFLFNSLNSIASLIDIHPQQAEKTVVDLSRLFRASLSLPRHIPIQKEIELCRSFVNIEQLRLGSRLRVDWSVGDVPDETQVLSLLIQPLLENAIYHGVQPSPEAGTVAINIKAVEKDIVIKVSNPSRMGPLPHAQLNRTEGTGIALANIRKRLEASYGRRAYLRVVKGETDFTVIVRYPAEL